ncbi:MAG: hypothetical protein LBG61_02515 [Burkholderiales bacterium]|jgi:hypothetical protein|nr:hypothetical protein [Burkholderiales bacterium]
MTSYAFCRGLWLVGLSSLSLWLAGCGDESRDVDEPVTLAAGERLAPDCQGAYCGAVNTTDYGGTGIGIWRYKNDSEITRDVSVTLSNIRNKTVTIIYTNETENNTIALPFVSPTATDSPVDETKTSDVLTDAGDDLFLTEVDREPLRGAAVNAIPDAVRLFDPTPYLQNAEITLTRPKSKLLRAARAPAIGDERVWNVNVNSKIEERRTVLKRLFSSGDRAIQIWVEPDEFGDDKMSDAMLDKIVDTVKEVIYPTVIELAGASWGAHQFAKSLIDEDQPLALVLVNFDKNRRGMGLLGYYWSKNQFTKETMSDSNEALALFLDTETFYLSSSGYSISPNATGTLLMLDTIAHEMTHMVEFYQRNVLNRNDEVDSSSYREFFQELPAMMMEDIVAQKVDARYHPIRDNYHKNWLWYGVDDFGCGLISFGKNCVRSPYYGYDATGSFGAYLLRRHGIGFFRRLFVDQSRADPLERLNTLLKEAAHDDTEDFARHVQRWGANIALLPASGSPDKYGFPERDEIDGHLPEINGENYRESLRLPKTPPAQLESFAFYPLTRKTTQSDTMSESFAVPPGVSLTVVVGR